MPHPASNRLSVDSKRYEDAVRLIEGGKRVGNAVYLHTSMLNEQAAAVLEIAVEVQSLAGRSEAFDVIRFSTSRPKVALLRYPGFFADPFPALQGSWLVDLEARSLTVSDFSSRANPPILHRKELLLAQGHPDRSRFECLTASLEDCGAYEHPSHLIGKRIYWATALAALGIDIQEHKVILGSQTSVSKYSNDGSVPRHRTALVRSRLSRPMQVLARCGFLEPGSAILDYACGRGDDVRALAAAGLDVSGWDPYFAPDTALAPADVVNLGTVDKRAFLREPFVIQSWSLRRLATLLYQSL